MGYFPVNLNKKCKVKLLPDGLEIWKNHLEKYREILESAGLKPGKTKVDVGGYSEFQIWELMEIFGEHMGIGCNKVMETEILVED